MSEKDKQHTGEVYFPGDPEILKEQIQYQEKLYDYNQTRPSEQEKRTNLLKEMFAEIGENCYIEPPFHANFGGHHCHFGKNVYVNYNLTAVDEHIRWIQRKEEKVINTISLCTLEKIVGWGPVSLSYQG